MGLFNRLPRTTLKQAVRTAAQAKPLALALEPRLMFDGAAVTTAAEAVVAAPEPVDAPATTADAGVDTLADALAGHAAPADRAEVVFVEGNVRDYQTLLDGLDPNVEVHVLDSSQDGLAQMASILDGRTGIDAIHIVSHGAEGELHLGTLTVTADNVQDHAADLATIGAALTADADILLYGCDVGAGSDGAALIEALAQATQADIAASIDTTGAAANGGDWELEAATGAIEAALPMDSIALQAYGFELAQVNFDFDGDTYTSGADVTTGTPVEDFSITVGGDTLSFNATSASPAYWIDTTDNAIGWTPGTGSEVSGVIAYGVADYSTSLELTVNGGDSFDLDSFGMVYSVGSFTSADYPIAMMRLTTDTGATYDFEFRQDFTGTAPETDWTRTIDVSGNTNFDGVTSVTITALGWRNDLGTVATAANTGNADADLRGFAVGIDNVRVSNITPPDTTAPTVTSIDRNTPASATTNADTLVYSVTFSEAVNNLSTGDFAVTGTTATVASVNTIVGNTYAVTVTGGNLAGVNGNVTLGFSGAQNITDTAGNPLTNTTPTGTNNNTYTLDNTAPNAPAVPDMSAGTDSGSSNTDNVTSDTTPTFAGTAEANSTVKLYTGGVTLIGTTTADGSGNWSITSSALSTGTQTITATATDAVGNTGAASGGLSITVDTSAAAPAALDLTSASDSGSSTTDNVTSDATPTINGTGEIGATVTLYDTDGTTSLGTATVDGSGNWSITASTLSAGAHTLTARQTDLAGNTSVASAGLSITIDTSAPAAPAVSAVSTDSGSSGTDEITSDTTLVISGTAEANSTVTVYRGGVSIGTTTANGAGNWSFDYTGTTLSQGTYNFTATATDAAGNTSGASVALAVTIDTAAAAPTGLDLAPASDSGSSSTDNLTSDTTPTVTGGGAEAGATVTLYDTDGTTSLGSATADGSGNWSITSSALGAGSHTLTAKQTDTAGNVSAASSGLSITIDTSAAAPSAPNLADASDSGSSNTDNITNDTTPTVTGTAEAGATVTLYDTDGTTSLGSATADGSGNWSITASTLSAGAHTLTAKQTDVAGNTSVASAGLAITIDTSAPSAPSAMDLSAGSDSGDSSTDNVTNDTTPTISGTGEVGATVTLYDTDGTTVLGTATVDGSGNWSIAASTLSEGTHTLTAKQTDVAGNVSAASSSLSITIDTTAPAAPAVSAISGDSGSSGTDEITNDTTLVISGTAVANTTVTVYQDGVSLGTTTANGAGSWIFDHTGTTLAPGNYDFTATATDAAGNASAASAALAVTVDTSAAAPSAPNLDAGSDTGSSNSDDITNDTTPTVSGTAEANATVTLYDTDGTTVLGTTTADGTGNWSITSSTLSEGAHTLTARQTDLAGNTSAASAGLAITIDTTAPAAGNAAITGLSTDSGSSNSDAITSDTTPTLSGTATAGSTVAIFKDGVQAGSATADGSGNWSYTFGALADGSYAITVAESDVAGNTGPVSSAYSITIDTTAAATSAPNLASASDTGSSNSDDITNDTTPTVSGSGAEAGATVTLYDTDGTTVLGTTTADGSGNWTITSSALAGGNHTLTAKQTDTAGNTSAASAGIAITIDTAAPAAPGTPDLAAASDTGSSNTDNITKDTTPTVSGTAEANARVTLYDTDGTTVLGTTTADGAGNWSITSSGLSEGAHTLTARQTDVAGNTGIASAGLAVTIDTTPPAAGSATITGGSTDSGSSNTDRITSDTTPTLSGTATAGSSVAIFRDGVQVGTATADGSGNWSYTSGALGDGSYAFTVRETDTAGNTGSASAAFNVTVDTAVAAPLVTAISSDSGTAGDGLTNDATLVISGTAEANATVSVSVDGIAVGNATADASGAWSFDYTGTTLANGAHSLTASATDLAGNASVTSAAFNITIDTNAPSAASGSLSVTENSAAGTAVGSVSASDTNGVSYSLIDDAGGRFMINASTGAITVASGASLDFESAASHDIVVRVTDGAGNSTDTAVSVAVTDVNDAPTAADGSISVNAGRPYTFTAAAFGFSDADAGDTLQQVEFVSIPASGTLALDGIALAAGDTVSRADLDAGRLTFTSRTSGTVSFGFRVSDGTASSTPYTFALNVTSADRPPVFAEPIRTPAPPVLPPATPLADDLAQNVVHDTVSSEQVDQIGGAPLWVHSVSNGRPVIMGDIGAHGGQAWSDANRPGQQHGVLEGLLDADIEFDLEAIGGNSVAEAEPSGHPGFVRQIAAISDQQQQDTERLARALHAHHARKA